MKSKTLAVLAGTLLLTSAAPTWAQSLNDDWYSIKDAKELQDLYSNKTFRGSGWVGHYRADGRGILIVGDLKPEPRTWKVQGSDQVCAYKSDGSVSCYRYMRNRQHAERLILTDVKSGMTYLFTVEEGIPNF